MKYFRLNLDEMANFAAKVIEYAENPQYQVTCDPGNERVVGGKKTQFWDVTIQQKAINQILHRFPLAPTFHFRFKTEHFSDRISLNWDKVETTAYHLDGQTGMIFGELHETLKEFLSSRILAAIQRPQRTPVERQVEAISG